MEKAGWDKKKFLIDGFPRNQNNKDGWDEVMGNNVNMKFVLFLEADEDNLKQRIEMRAYEAKKKGEEPRKDDNVDTLNLRINVFKE